MLIKNLEQHSFSLENFEGPLDFLLYLIQKNEIDIYNISLKQIIEQYKIVLEKLADPCVESGAEFVGMTASLIWIKSKMLLPKHEQETDLNEEIDPEFAIIHHLIDYCRFKEVAKELAHREQRQSNFYFRGLDSSTTAPKRYLGIEHLAIEDLTSVFQEFLHKAKLSKGVIEGETWAVSDKIRLIRNLLIEQLKIELNFLFSSEQCREEMIVCFLAILELMKLGEIHLVKEQSSSLILIIPTKNHG